MRKEFFRLLYQLMDRDKKIYALTADLGYGGFDRIKDSFPKRYLNVGASEQAMMDIAVGLAQSGMVPFTYTITPFYLRAFEGLRTYLNYEKHHVIMIGSGRDKDYEHDGISHWADDIDYYLSPLENIVKFYPESNDQMKTVVDSSLYMKQPVFISLKR